MTPTLDPEQKARVQIDKMLEAAGWVVQNKETLNLNLPAVACEEVSLKPGHGEVDYLLYVDGKAIGVVEAKAQGATLTGVEIQSERYASGLPDQIEAWYRPLPFIYESTGIETRFTNLLEPTPRSREVYAFHKPETLRSWVKGESLTADAGTMAKEPTAHYGKPPTLESRILKLPPLIKDQLWPKQITAIENLEKSLKQHKRRALIQMATGSGKTFTAINSAYRLIKYSGAKRILFLVDRKNLGVQAKKEFDRFETPDDHRKFPELFNVQLLQGNTIQESSRVCISTIQRVFSLLKGDTELGDDAEESSAFESPIIQKEPFEVSYNPNIPPETFDFIVIDECHRSIYNLWRQVLEYFDAYLIGLTATPSKHTVGFFQNNQVMHYPHAEAVADNVNVDFYVYRIRTKITEAGSTVEAKNYVTKRDRRTRQKRLEQLDEDYTYEAKVLDRDVVAPDQIRTVIRTFKEKLFTEIFPGRTEVPKTLVFAKDDNHAETIVQIIREEFGEGNNFCEKITYRTSQFRLVTKEVVDGKEVEKIEYKKSGVTAEELIKSFTNSFNPRIAVTVDMIATGTDTKPVEIVFFMRSPKSENYFEQMKGRGVRVMNKDDLLQVTPDAKNGKTHFVIVDAVGACESEKQVSRPLDRNPSAPFESLLQTIAQGSMDPDALSTLATRMARLAKKLAPEDHQKIQAASGGKNINEISRLVFQALDAEKQDEEAKKRFGGGKDTYEPTEEQLNAIEKEWVSEAVKPFRNPALREVLLDLKRQEEQTIDEVSQDVLLQASYSEEARKKAEQVIQDFEKWLKENHEELETLRILYSVPYRRGLSFKEIKTLAQEIQKPPRSWTPQRLWDAYERLDQKRVKGRAAERQLSDIISIIRFALKQDPQLVPFEEHVNQRFGAWLLAQENRGTKFTQEQLQWLHDIKNAIAKDVGVDRDLFEEVPFNQKGGLAKAAQLFGNDLDKILDDLNRALVA